jgi:MFS family permease
MLEDTGRKPDAVLTLPETPPAATAARAELRDEWAIVQVTSVAHTLCHVGELVFAGATLAIMREFGLEPHQATALGLLGYVLMGAGAIPVGLWADAWGPTLVLRVYFLAMAAAGVFVAVAPNIETLFVALTALGLAASMYHPTGLAMISLGVSARGRAMGINGVAGSIGVAVGPLLGMEAAARGHWRLAYVVVAGLALLGFAFMELALRRDRRQHALCGLNGRLSPDSEPSAEIPERRKLADYLPLVLLMGAMLLGGFNYRSLLTALPPFLAGGTAEPRELAQAGWFVFGALLVGGFGQLFGGWRSDKSGALPVYIGLLIVLAAATFTLGWLGVPSVPLICLVAFSLFGLQPVENALLAESTSKDRRSLSYGIKFALTFGVGALGSQVAGEIWHETGSTAPVFYVIGGAAVVMALLTLAYIVRTGARRIDPS